MSEPLGLMPESLRACSDPRDLEIHLLEPTGRRESAGSEILSRVGLIRKVLDDRDIK
jgi:hypothetical protein